jgi:hypothetical protein
VRGRRALRLEARLKLFAQVAEDLIALRDRDQPAEDRGRRPGKLGASWHDSTM